MKKIWGFITDKKTEDAVAYIQFAGYLSFFVFIVIHYFWKFEISEMLAAGFVASLLSCQVPFTMRSMVQVLQQQEKLNNDEAYELLKFAVQKDKIVVLYYVALLIFLVILLGFGTYAYIFVIGSCLMTINCIKVAIAWCICSLDKRELVK